MNNAADTDIAIDRRLFSQHLAKALFGLTFLALGADAGVRRCVRRRVRRRTRRRIRRRITWRTVNNVRVVVVPVDIAVQDELIMEDGSVATITRVGKKNITVTVNKKEQTLPAVYEGTVEEQESEPGD